MFIALLGSIVNVSNHTKYISLSNEKCKIQPTLINLLPNEHSQEFYYYPVSVKLDRCTGSCNTLNDLPSKVYVLNKPKHLNLIVFKMITGINESKTLTNHTWFDGKNIIQINDGISINVDISVTKIMYVKKIMFGVLLHVILKMENIYGDSVIMCDEVIESYGEEIKTITTNFDEKNVTCKVQSFDTIL